MNRSCALLKYGLLVGLVALGLGPTSIAGAADCNANGVDDAVDIADANSDDCNINGIPDECEGDFDGDATIDGCDDCGLQILENNLDDSWGERQSASSQGRVLWFDENDAVYFYDGTAAELIQERDDNVDSLAAVADFVFHLGSGAGAGDVIGGWRRGTDFAWIFQNNNQPPRLVNATNPYDPALPVNPEAVAIADGCVFFTLQSFDPDSPLAIGIKHVYQVDPASGDATLLTGNFLDDGDTAGGGAWAVGFVTSGCKAAWSWTSCTHDPSPNPETPCPEDEYELHYFDGTDVHVLEEFAIPTSFSQGRLIYLKEIGGVRQVFLYDTNLAIPLSEQLTDFDASDKRVITARTDGRHLAILRCDANGQDCEIITLGGFVLTDANTRPTSQPDNNVNPIQVDRGQLFWETHEGSFMIFDGRTLDTVCSQGWMADGFVGMSRKTDSTGPDSEIFLKDAGGAADKTLPYSPWVVTAEATANGEVTLNWEPILGATSYNIYYANEPGVTKDAFGALFGGQMLSGVAQATAAISGLSGDSAWYFVVTAVDGGGEGADSAEASAVPCVDAALDSDDDGTPDCEDECPADAAKTEPGDCGCGNEDEDANGNGVSDCLDDDTGNTNANENDNQNGNDNAGPANGPFAADCGDGACGGGAVLPMAALMAAMPCARRLRQRHARTTREKQLMNRHRNVIARTEPSTDRGRAWLAIALCVALPPLGGAASCDPDCTPFHPDYDPETGTCSQPADEPLGPPVFGSGGLPTEPDAPTAQPDDTHNPDDVAMDIYGLNGRWRDRGYEVCIQHTGSGVYAAYTELRECDHADGTGNVSYYFANFEGDLSGDTITGTVVSCTFGFDEPGVNGLVDSPMTLTVSADGKTLTGSWYNAVDDVDEPIEMTRETVGNCHAPRD